MRKTLIPPMHLALSKDDLRPDMQHAYVYGGYMYATDAHILAKLKMSETIFGEALEGLAFNAEQLKLMSSSKYTGFVVVANSVTLVDKNGEEITFCAIEQDQGSVRHFGDLHAPDFDAVIPKTEEELTSIGVNTKLLNNLVQALGYENGVARLTFNGEERAIKVTNTRTESIGVIMPLIRQG